jgi:hypothetical protein
MILLVERDPDDMRAGRRRRDLRAAGPRMQRRQDSEASGKNQTLGHCCSSTARARRNVPCSISMATKSARRLVSPGRSARSRS